MRTINSPRAHTATTHRGASPSVRSEDAPASRPSPRLIADAVIAGYIHDISHATRRSSGRRDSRRLMTQPV
jgi:hypothetical protein